PRWTPDEVPRLGIIDGSFAGEHFDGVELGGVPTRDIFVHVAALLVDVVDQGLDFGRRTLLHNTRVAIGLFTHEDGRLHPTGCHPGRLANTLHGSLKALPRRCQTVHTWGPCWPVLYSPIVNLLCLSKIDPPVMGCICWCTALLMRM